MKGIDKFGDKQFQMTDHSWNVFLNHILIIFPRKVKFTNSPALGKYSAFSVSSFSFSYFFLRLIGSVSDCMKIQICLLTLEKVVLSLGTAAHWRPRCIDSFLGIAI